MGLVPIKLQWCHSLLHRVSRALFEGQELGASRLTRFNIYIIYIYIYTYILLSSKERNSITTSFGTHHTSIMQACMYCQELSHETVPREGNEREIIRWTKFISLPIQRICTRRFSSQVGYQLYKSPPPISQISSCGH